MDYLHWFENHFVHEARTHCTSVGLASDAKIMLILDNCSAHPNAELLVKDNVFAVYLTPKCMSLIQPLDHRILCSFKSHYNGEFLSKMLTVQ
jgi:hypothetical protein